MIAAFLFWFGLGCSGCGGTSAPSEAPPAPAPDAPVKSRGVAPTVQFVLPTREVATPVPVTKGDDKLAKALAGVREPMFELVERYGRNPQNPWAIAHAMLVLGPEMIIPGANQPAVEFLAENYGQPRVFGRERLWTFPPKLDGMLVDVHTDMLLKGFTEGGLSPDREVIVDGGPTTLGALYRHSLQRAWTDGRITGYQHASFNDVPWALQALTAWAPTHLSWKAPDGSEMRLQDLTRGLREAIAKDTAAMKQARDTGQVLKKDIRQGFFGWTCGGQHALQGFSYAVARGFGNAADNKEVCDQIDLLSWRTDVELNAVDPIIQQGNATIQVLLYVQRLKYLGHTLETVHKAAAMGVCELTPDRQMASRRVATELVITVQALEKLGAFGNIDRIASSAAFDQIRKGGGKQVMLDLIGDSAHAIRGIDMATGEGTIRY